MKKLTLGKKTLLSIHGQIETILASIHGGKIEIKKVKPQRTNTENFLWVNYRISTEPQLTRGRIFAMQRVGNCCDVWLESPSNRCGDGENDAA
jgi:hypothetical protein